MQRSRDPSSLRFDLQQGLPLARLVLVFTIALGFIASGCAVKLAPSYDRSIVEGLSTANEQTLILFASVSSGVPSTTFANRETTYNGLIGKFDALRIQAAARPMPRPLFTQIFAGGPSADTAPKELDVLKAPTPGVLDTVLATLTEMRNTDRSSGLTSTRVMLFKNEFSISMEQALVYGKVLKR
jgi:hypothetical protein